MDTNNYIVGITTIAIDIITVDGPTNPEKITSEEVRWTR